MSERTGAPLQVIAGTARRRVRRLGSVSRSALSRKLSSSPAPAPAPPHAPVAADAGRPGRRTKPKRPNKPNKPSESSESVKPGKVLAAYGRVVRRVVGEEEAGRYKRFRPEQTTEVAQRARRQRALAVFTEEIARGTSVPVAHAVGCRALVEEKLRHEARALTLGLESLPDGDKIRRAGLGQVVLGMGHYALAWDQFAELDVDTLAERVPVEAASAALFVGTPEAVAVARSIGERTTAYDVTASVNLAGRFLATGHLDLARALVEEVENRDLDSATRRDRGLLANLRRWTHPVPVQQPAPGAISVGVIDYHQPDYDRASRNVGDYVQTLAMLGNLARFQRTRFTGADGLGDLATSLQARVKPQLRRDSGDAEVHLTPVSRDFSEGDDLPESTWMVAFGWHMHSMFRLRFGLPYHPHVNPIFVSFHVNRVNTLTPQALDYLRAHGPIGCRDWTTVDLLLSAGVDAFFSGCLTTTVDAVFPDLADVEREQPGVVAVIDLPRSVADKARRKVVTVSHGDAEYREADLVQGTHAADHLLTTYQRRFRRILTSRLHSYLPATSLGVDVSFQPHIPGDVRFDGLMGMKPGLPAFEGMRDGIRDLLARTFELILDGADRETVYARWRELTADRVAEARKRFHAATPAPELRLDLPAVVDQIRASQRRYGPHDEMPAHPLDRVTDVALSLDANFATLLPVTVQSLVDNASGPVRLWITARGLGEDYEAWFGRSFPDVPVTFLNFDGVEYGEIGRMIRHISIATMDCLLLPEVLADLDRITYVDIDTVTTGDVCELARVDLEGKPLAARTSVHSGAHQWRLAGDNLSRELASDLRRTMAARHPFDFMTFNAGVLVLDLARMRSDHFVAEQLPLAERYGLNDQDLLNAYVGANRVELDARWNAWPVQESVGEPGIVHYAGAGKPWGDMLVPYGELWTQYASRVWDRIGPPPA